MPSKTKVTVVASYLVDGARQDAIGTEHYQFLELLEDFEPGDLIKFSILGEVEDVEEIEEEDEFDDWDDYGDDEEDDW